ncbi:general substrate transporter [Amylocarpus encephaloides]|uniref:General substrate transporter n=1 Tax=Amylocarpus encephaloides TaxID=45428 RepID=A0A9P7YLG1_9HELO|nr:general substrate transporter [Amylocarpus encephaloides]
MKEDTTYLENVDDSAARIANQEDHELTPIQAAKRNPRTVLWCCYAIWLLILNSFENQAAGSALGIPQFRQDFGYKYGDEYVLSAAWQGAFNGGPVATAVLGSFLAGCIADSVGRKLCFASAFFFSVIGITLEVVATNSPVFFAGKLVNGLAIGGFVATGFTYVGEIAPTALRGILSSASAIAFTIGPLLVALIQKGEGAKDTRWAYRSIFVSQYGVWFIGVIFLPWMPESPWWLISKGKESGAAKALKQLGYTPGDVEKRMSAILLTLEQVKAETEGVSFAECFRGSNLRRTMISILPLTIQALSGIFFMASYSTYYYQSVFSADKSFILQIIQQVVSLVGNICSWFVVDNLGRRNVQFYGLLLLTALLLIIAGLATVATHGALVASCALMIFYCFGYNATIGATGFTILTETSTSRLRIKTIAIGNGLQNAVYTMWSFVIPYIFNPDRANLGGKTCFIFGGLAVFCLVYLWFCQPETAGRTYEEMDEMFMKGVPARKFKGYVTDAELRGREAKAAQEEIVVPDNM